MDRRFVAIFVVILLAGAALRLLTLRYGTFTEPDSYVYYSVAQQTMANNLTITSQLSGFPVHNPFNEMPGLIYMAIAFSYITRNLYTAMLLLPVAFAFFEIMATYLLAYRLSGNKCAGLLAAFLFATMPGAIMKNIAGEWRGETFVPLFIAAALLALIYAYERRDTRLYALSAVPLALSVWTWKGGVYAVAVVAVLAVLFAVYKAKKSLLYVAAAAALLCAAGFAVFSQLGGTGIYTVTTALNTIAELQAPSATFLVLQFGLAVGLAPVGALLYALKDRYRKDRHMERSAFTFMAVLSLFAVTMALQLNAVRYMTLVAMPIAVFAAYVMYAFYSAPQKRGPWVRLIVISVVAVSAVLGAVQTQLLGPGDGINAQFLSALSWIRNNTASNATFLTNWPDGSLVEGVAMRQSYSDSGVVGSAWQLFPRFLFAKQGNLTYLSEIRPDCILVRSYWIGESEAITLEGGLPANSSLNGTNFMALENGSIGLPLAYDRNGTFIYGYEGNCSMHAKRI